jgi:fructose-1,6-bisphosphatase II
VIPTYDAIVIGTGQSGPPLAARLSGAGMKVAVIEQGKFAKVPVVLDRYAGTTFLGVLSGALSAEAVLKGRSLFAGRVGEQVGSGWGPEVDIALDPLECTNSVAYGRPNAMAVIALAARGHFLHAPDTYMEKIAVGPKAAQAIDLSRPIEENLEAVAAAKGYHIDDLTVVVLDRPRHEDLIQRIRKTGARIHLIPDGDVSAAIATALDSTGVDVLVGTGGAPEGVLAAAALRCLGGAIQGRLLFRSDEEKARARKMGISDFGRVYRETDLASGDSITFASTGVTDGDMLDGVRFTGNMAETH